MSEHSSLAIFGGPRVRSKKMPARFAYGENEVAHLNRAMEYYRARDEDPGYAGPFEKELCDRFVEFQGGGYADAVSTGTASLYIALKALDLPPGSDILISPVTDSGPLACIILQGFRPVVVDSAPNSFNVGVAQFLERITPRTSAFLAIHAAGEPLQIDSMVFEAKKRGIRVIEDCSQASGALCAGQRVGTFGDIAGFSTMYRKILTAGPSSGIVYTKDHHLYQMALAHADRGKPIWRTDLDLRDPSHALFPALNFNTDELSCALGIGSLERLPEALTRRKNFVRLLCQRLVAESDVCQPYNFNENFSPFYFPIFVNTQKLSCSKIQFAEALAAEGIGVGVHYGCLVSTWAWARPHLSDDFVTKNAIDTRDRSFNLYLNEHYGEEEVNDILLAIRKIADHYRRV